MASIVSNILKQKINKEITLSAVGIMAALVKSTMADVDVDTLKDETSWGNLSATYEISGTGYTARGKALANPTYTVDNTLNLAKFDADDLSWASSTLSARGVGLYLSGTNDWMGFVDFGEDQVSRNSSFNVTWSSTYGILTTV